MLCAIGDTFISDIRSWISNMNPIMRHRKSFRWSVTQHGSCEGLLPSPYRLPLLLKRFLPFLRILGQREQRDLALGE
jgi:hypothetical protein